MPDVSHLLTLTGTLERTVPAQAASGAWPESYAPVKSVQCRISQPPATSFLVGFQEGAELEPVIYFGPDEDVRERDRLTVTGGDPTRLIGSIWLLRGVVGPSVGGVYLKASGRSVQRADASVEP
jgi:hypothetical protein